MGNGASELARFHLFSLLRQGFNHSFKVYPTSGSQCSVSVAFFALICKHDSSHWNVQFLTNPCWTNINAASRRRSCAGWNVWNVVLDFAGAVLSLAQLVGDAVDLNDYSSITGNVAKLGLSIISIGFDVSNQEVPWFILYRPFFLQIIILETWSHALLVLPMNRPPFSFNTTSGIQRMIMMC